VPAPCTCTSTKPGITQTSPAVDFVVGVARLAVGLLRQPGPAGLAHRGDPLPSMTMSIGLRGGPPVPSIRVTPRMTIFLNGPAPSPGWRAGAALSAALPPRPCRGAWFAGA
jgi:hypothetical protein